MGRELEAGPAGNRIEEAFLVVFPGSSDSVIKYLTARKGFAGAQARDELRVLVSAHHLQRASG